MADGLWAAHRRALTAGLVLTMTFVAAEGLAVVTVMPVVARDLHGLNLYGWAFSSFMLGTVVGIVAAGRAADRRGPAVPYLVGLGLFCVGLAVAGFARQMPVLVVGRALQGLGGGTVPAISYVAMGRCLPERLRARMMAVLSTAWVVPGLAGPALSAEIARLFGWRWVFLGLLPFVAVCGAVALPALIRLGAPAQRGEEAHRVSDGVRVAVAVGLALAGLNLMTSAPLAGVGLLVCGVLIGLTAVRRLVPAGTFTAVRGMPATIAGRFLVTFTFFGADAFVTLAITTVRHRSPVFAGVAVTGATLAWTVGAWIQARYNQRVEGRTLVRTGVLIILAGTALLVLVLLPRVPVATGVAAWTVAGLGMGLCNAQFGLMMLRAAPPGQEGWASASLNLADVLGSAIGIGICGTAIAIAQGTGWELASGIAVALAISALAGVFGLFVSGRLPSTKTSRATGPDAGPVPAEAEVTG